MVLLACAWAVEPVLAADPVHVAQAAAQRSYAIPAGPLAAALNRFADASGLQLIYGAEVTQDLRTPGVSGTYAPEQALRLLLAGTGLDFRFISANTVTLQRAAVRGEATPLGPVLVEGNEVAAPTATIGALPPEYAGGQVARGGRLGLLGNRDVMDTPFNTSSYTAQLMQDQQARTVADVVANDPSVRATAPSGGILDSFFIRGFPINEGNVGDVAFDGMYGVAPTFRLFTDYAERVEVVKGPTALLNGIAPNGAIGGTINIVPKRAGSTDLTRVTVDYASDLQAGTHLDWSRRFGNERQFGLRFNGSYHDGDTAVDNQSRKAPVGAVAFDYQGERLRATFDGIAQREEFIAPQRPLFPVAGIAIPEAPDGHSNLQQPWERSRIDDVLGVARVEYDVTDNVTLFAAGGGGNSVVKRLFGTPTITSSAGAASVLPQNFIFDIDRTTGEGGLRTRFDTAMVVHNLTLQASAFQGTINRGFNSGTAQPTNIFNPVARPFQNLPEPAQVSKISESEFFGLSLADTLSVLDERVQLTLGARRQQIDAQNFSAATGAVTSASDKVKFTPLAGLVVKPWSNLSLYANYVEGLSLGDIAPGVAANAGEMLPPHLSQQVEVGAKVDFGRVIASLSLFQIDRPFGQLETRGAALVFTEGGEQRNRGIELSAFGELVPGIRLLGGITLIDGELTKTTSAATRGNTPIGVPAVQLNLGGEWDLPFLEGLTVSGRVIHTTEQSVNQANTQEIPGWTRLDLGARYRTTIGGTPVAFRATVENMLDTDYWAGVASFGTLTQGAPRTVLLSVTADF